MIKTALHITTAGPINEVEVHGLVDLQSLVGGYIEPFSVYEDRGWTIYVNDDGMYSCEPNRAVFADKGLADAGYLSQFSDFIEPVKEDELYCILFGDIVVIGHDPMTGDDKSLTPEQMDEIKAMFSTPSMGPGSGYHAAMSVKMGIVPNRAALTELISQS